MTTPSTRQGARKLPNVARVMFTGKEAPFSTARIVVVSEEKIAYAHYCDPQKMVPLFIQPCTSKAQASARAKWANKSYLEKVKWLSCQIHGQRTGDFNHFTGPDSRVAEATLRLMGERPPGKGEGR